MIYYFLIPYQYSKVPFFLIERYRCQCNCCCHQQLTSSTGLWTLGFPNFKIIVPRLTSQKIDTQILLQWDLAWGAICVSTPDLLLSNGWVYWENASLGIGALSECVACLPNRFWAGTSIKKLTSQDLPGVISLLFRWNKIANVSELYIIIGDEEKSRLIIFVTDARAVISERLLGTNSTLLYLIGLWSC